MLPLSIDFWPEICIYVSLLSLLIKLRIMFAYDIYIGLLHFADCGQFKHWSISLSISNGSLVNRILLGIMKILLLLGF